MNTEFCRESYNSLPDFSDVCELSDQSFDELMEIGRIIATQGYEKIFGAVILHKHFPAGKGEIVLRKRVDDCSFLYTIPSPGKVRPISWMLDAESDELIPIEFQSEKDFSKQYPDLRSLKQLLNLIDKRLLNKFGLVWLPSFKFERPDVYEVADEHLKISILSQWNGEDVGKDIFAKSVFAFKQENGDVVIDETVSCGNCNGCYPSITFEDERSSAGFTISKNAFGLGVDVAVSAERSTTEFDNLLAFLSQSVDSKLGRTVL